MFKGIRWALDQLDTQGRWADRQQKEHDTQGRLAEERESGSAGELDADVAHAIDSFHQGVGEHSESLLLGDLES